MAGIQIPTVERMNPVDEAPAARLDVKTPDLAKDMAGDTEAVSKLGTAAEAYAYKVENEAAEVEATKREYQYSAYYQSLMYGDGKSSGIKYQEGDPTKLYKDMDDQLKTKFDELSGDDSLSRRAKNLTLQKLTQKAGVLDAHKNQEFGRQKNQYESSVTESGVANEKSDMVDAVALIKPGDASSYGPFEQSIAKIRELRLQSAIRTGTAVPDEETGETMLVGADGKMQKLKVSSMAQYDLKKDLSDGIYGAIDNAVKSGNVEVAKDLKERYGDFLDPVKKNKLEETTKKADIEDQAYQAAVDTKNMSPTQIDKYISKLDPEVQDKALKVIEEKQSRMQQIQDRASKKNYSYLANHVADTMRSDSPYAGTAALESDPVFKQTIDQIKDPKQKQAIYDAVEQPKKSNAAAIGKMQDLMFGDDEDGESMKGMDPGDFNQYLSGLSSRDRNKYTRRFEQMNSETGAQTIQRYKQVGKEVQDQAIDIGLIKRDQFGHISGGDEKKLIELRGEIDDHLDKQGDTPMSPKDIKDYARKFVLSKKTGSVFEDAPEKAPVFSGTRNPPAPTPPPGPPALVKGKTRVQWNKEYLKQGKGAATPQQLDKYIQDQP